MEKAVDEKTAKKDKLLADVEKYCQMAIDAGAVQAKAVKVSDTVVQRIRTRLKCIFPRCDSFGTTTWCPPDADIGWENAQAIVNSYEYAIVWRIPAKLKFQTGTAGMHRFMKRYKKHFSKEIREYWEDYLEKQPPHEEHKSGPVVEIIEKEARKDGHYFATTFAYGNCAHRLCEDYGCHCIGFKTGGLCRFPEKSRPDGAGALYLDMLGTNAKLGWENLNVGWSMFPEDFPPGTEFYLRTSILFIE